MIDVGSRVLKKGWAQHESFHYLARRGRVLRVADPGRVVVRWDSSAECGPPFGSVVPAAPARVALERTDDLLWLWWRST